MGIKVLLSKVLEAGMGEPRADVNDMVGTEDWCYVLVVVLLGIT